MNSQVINQLNIDRQSSKRMRNSNRFLSRFCVRLTRVSAHTRLSICCCVFFTFCSFLKQGQYQFAAAIGAACSFLRALFTSGGEDEHVFCTCLPSRSIFSFIYCLPSRLRRCVIIHFSNEPGRNTHPNICINITG